MDVERRGGRRSQISDDEIRSLMDKGMRATQIAQHFTQRGRSITQQAISLRIKRLTEDGEERANRLLPWPVRTEHARGWVYTAVVAYAKHQQGAGITPAQLDQSRKLEQYLKDRDAVVTYDHDAGFILRNRRPEDGATALVT